VATVAKPGGGLAQHVERVGPEVRQCVRIVGGERESRRGVPQRDIGRVRHPGPWSVAF
jgi:hypothetical protein